MSASDKHPETHSDKAELLNSRQIRELLYQRFIAPTTKHRKQFAGIEIELPLVNLKSAPVNFHVVHSLTSQFQEHFNFLVSKLDNHGNTFALESPINGDLYTYDCSYNNLEISFGKTDKLGDVDDRFRDYLEFIQTTLAAQNHCVTGMGINPHRNINWNVPLPTGRYRMLFHHLSSAATIKAPMFFHPFYDYGMFTSASQVQIDVDSDQLIQTLKASDLLEPFKAVLFANSPLDFLGDNYLCARDLLWEHSMQGYNPHNIGVFEHPVESIEELLDYLSSTSIYCVERDGHYINFKPMLITDYFATTQLNGEYFGYGQYQPITFSPRISDLEYLRTYKFADLTFRGTIEFRSICTQPLSDTMAAPALHLGLMNQSAALLEILEQDDSIYGHGYTTSELRKLLVKRWPKSNNPYDLPDFIDTAKLQSTLLKILDLAHQGLVAKAKKDERFLDPLFERAQKLESPALKALRQQENGISLDKIIQENAVL
jgi:gamma-glutamylcysteine synthetase